MTPRASRSVRFWSRVDSMPDFALWCCCLVLSLGIVCGVLVGVMAAAGML